MPDFGPEGNLEPVRMLPVASKVPNKVAYTVNEHPPSVFDLPINRDPSTPVPHTNLVLGGIAIEGMAQVWIGEKGFLLEGRSFSLVGMERRVERSPRLSSAC